MRQPLRRIAIPANDEALKADIAAVRQLILDEVNVKELEFVETGLLQKSVKCNFRVMGKKFGKLMKAVATVVGALSQDDIARLETEGKISLQADGQDIVVERDDVDIISQDIPGWSVEHDGALTVALDLTLTDELRREGLAREVVKRIQAYRKESGFDITDRISILFEDNAVLRAAVEAHQDYIASQVLAEEITFGTPQEAVTFEFEDFKAGADVKKV